MSFAQYMALKKGPLPPMFVHVTSKKGPIFYICFTNILLAESNLNFYFDWKFASAWKSISHCKLFEVIWLNIVLCLHIKFVKGTPLAHIFALFWKKYDLLQSLRLQSGSSAFKHNNAKTKCESLKEGLRDISEKWGPRDDSLVRLPYYPPLLSIYKRKN